MPKETVLWVDSYDRRVMLDLGYKETVCLNQTSPTSGRRVDGWVIPGYELSVVIELLKEYWVHFEF